MHRSPLIISAALTVLATAAWAKPDAQALRKVDWKNHTYTHADGPKGGTTLKNGEWAMDHMTGDEIDYSESLSLHGVVYADLDGDGVEEAAVHLNYWGGGTGRFDAVNIYAADDKGKPKQIGRLPGGDRGDGGVANIKARPKDKAIELSRMSALSADGACCPSLLFIERWGMKNGKLVEQREHIKVTSFEEKTDDAKGSYQSHYQAGLVELKAQAYDVATRHFIDALMFKPGDASATGKLGFALMKTGDFAAADVLSAAAAVQSNPKKKAMILYNAGKVALESGEYSEYYAEAVKYFEASLALRPGNKPTLKALAEAKAALAKTQARDAARAKEAAKRKAEAAKKK
ncbi:MAG: tetratricopeptide repeat protein [Bradymonadia bacterium]